MTSKSKTTASKKAKSAGSAKATAKAKKSPGGAAAAKSGVAKDKKPASKAGASKAASAKASAAKKSSTKAVATAKTVKKATPSAPKKPSVKTGTKPTPKRAAKVASKPKKSAPVKTGAAKASVAKATSKAAAKTSKVTAQKAPVAKKAVAKKPQPKAKASQPKAKASQPKASQPKASQPRASQPKAKASQPKASQPKAKASQPKASQPKASQPKASQPKASQPKASQPRASQPKASQPKASQPKAKASQAKAAAPSARGSAQPPASAAGKRSKAGTRPPESKRRSDAMDLGDERIEIATKVRESQRPPAAIAPLPIPVIDVPAPPTMEERAADIQIRLARQPDDFRNHYESTLEMSWIYHDSALEGVVYYYDELRTALTTDAQAAVDSNLQPTFDEIRRHREAIEFVKDFGLNKKAPLTLDIVKKIYLILKPSEGDLKTVKYRKEVPQHRLYFHEYTQPDKVGYKMRQVVDWVNDPETKRTRSTVHIAARAHYDILRVFPFPTESGKVARLVMNLLLFRGGLPAAIIHSAERQRYYDALKTSPNTVLNMVQEALENSISSVEKMLDEHETKKRAFVS